MKKIKNIYNGKDFLVAFQHMLAMIGGTILIPIACGMNVSMAIISAGIGTILFFFVVKGKVPVFLGSSFTFLVAYTSIMSSNINAENGETLSNLFYTNYDLWCTNMGKLVVALWFVALCYVIFSIIIKTIGTDKIKKIFSPIVVGPIVVLIGLILCQSIIQNDIWAQISGNVYGGYVGTVPAWKVWTTVVVTLITIISVNVYTKPRSIFRVMPIIFGFIVGSIYAIIIGYPMEAVNINSIVIFQDVFTNNSILGFWGHLAIDWTAILLVVPIAIVSILEHIGDISANSIVCKKDFLADPGLHRTVLGDGIATAFASFLGGPSNTTYSQNTAILAMTKNYKSTTILLAGIFAVILGIFVPFASIIHAIPKPVVGASSLILFGMISSSGLRNLFDNKIDLGKTKNLICVSFTLACGMGFSIIGGIQIGSIEVSALCIATLVAVFMNLVIPDDSQEILENFNPVKKDDYAIKDLIENRDNEFVFHGSAKELDSLKPMKANDSNGAVANIDNAVFLASDFLNAVPYAFKDKIIESSKGLNWSFSIPSNESDIKMIMKDVRIDENITGYVYVIKKTDDMVNDPDGSKQWKSYKELVPLQKIVVRYKDYAKYFKIEK